MNKLSTLLAAIALAVLSSQAFAVNKFPLKPDGANTAPCTVVGSPYGELECSAIVLTKGTAGTGGSATLGLYRSSTVIVTSDYMTLISSGGAVLSVATPSIATSTVLGGVTTEFKSGTILVISSTDSVNTVTLQSGGTLTGSQLRLGSSSRLISKYNTLGLIYDALDHAWTEMFFSSNVGN